MKTIKDYFNELDSFTSKLAIENTDELVIDTEAKSLCDALRCAFTWKSTEQGHLFWAMIEDYQSSK